MEMLQREDGAESHAIGTWRNLVLSLWRVTPTVEQVEKLRRAVNTALARHPKGMGLVVIAQLPASPPAEDARKSFIALTEEAQSGMKAAAVVAEGKGFGAAVVRSVTTGVVLLARSRVPTRVFAESPEASAWLSDELGRAHAGCGSATELEAAIQALRAIRS
ncbi:MAG: hypothetical protein AB2A00_34195 [Myxococcota bacterium]